MKLVDFLMSYVLCVTQESVVLTIIFIDNRPLIIKSENR